VGSVDNQELLRRRPTGPDIQAAERAMWQMARNLLWREVKAKREHTDRNGPKVLSQRF